MELVKVNVIVKAKGPGPKYKAMYLNPAHVTCIELDVVDGRAICAVNLAGRSILVELVEALLLGLPLGSAELEANAASR